MVDWNDFDYEEPAVERETDEYEISARNILEEFFEKNSSGVFFGNQLAVQNEDRFFHWITYRAIADLIEGGLIHTERPKMAIGSEIKLVWHRKHRYYKRDAKRVIDLVDEYGSPKYMRGDGVARRADDSCRLRKEAIRYARPQHSAFPRSIVDRDGA
jgi:hypothetical protein